MAELGKTVKQVYDAMLTAYRACKDKKEGAKDALESYEKNLEFIEEAKKTLVDLDDLVDALQESLNVISEQRSRNQVKNTQIKTKGSIVSKFVPCGKNCNGCIHDPYLYKVSP
jgi:predicted  nucleic acid-binding Zn-ribbon protein